MVGADQLPADEEVHAPAVRRGMKLLMTVLAAELAPAAPVPRPPVQVPLLASVGAETESESHVVVGAHVCPISVPPGWAQPPQQRDGSGTRQAPRWCGKGKENLLWPWRPEACGSWGWGKPEPRAVRRDGRGHSCDRAGHWSPALEGDQQAGGVRVGERCWD